MCQAPLPPLQVTGAHSYLPLLPGCVSTERVRGEPLEPAVPHDASTLWTPDHTDRPPLNPQTWALGFCWDNYGIAALCQVELLSDKILLLPEATMWIESAGELKPIQ